MSAKRRWESTPSREGSLGVAVSRGTWKGRGVWGEAGAGLWKGVTSDAGFRAMAILARPSRSWQEAFQGLLQRSRREKAIG